MILVSSCEIFDESEWQTERGLDFRNDNGYLALASTSGFIVSLVASSSIQVGVLKQVAAQLAKALGQPLQEATTLK